ncbi:hypothetical protein evm_002374 [Chilo suppressalis]|nr:hypothetical protein evm_002374 [Chilo suppressalis]
MPVRPRRPRTAPALPTRLHISDDSAGTGSLSPMPCRLADWSWILIEAGLPVPAIGYLLVCVDTASRLSWTGDLDSLTQNAARSIFPAHAWSRSTSKNVLRREKK